MKVCAAANEVPFRCCLSKIEISAEILRYTFSKIN